MQTAPELFHFLPDLQTAGSVLGDGGFAETARLPKRRLDEYDDVSPFIAPHSNSSSSSTSARHVLLKALYDGEEVVLKGFIMNEGDQRKGFERETSILGRLKNDAIICPGAVVEDTGYFESGPIKVAIFIEYPFMRGGNLSSWLKVGSRKPWELQGVARQLLYGIMYLHDHGVIHKDIKPSNVLMHEDGRLVLSDFELSKEVDSRADNDEPPSVSRAGTRGFMAPEVEAGERAVFASDMYSFGALLYFMYFPSEFGSLLPGQPRLAPSCDPELADLITKLVVLSAASRPSAASALMHPYFRSTFMERLLKDGEIVEQDRKLDAVRNLIHRARSDNRNNLEKITTRRDNVVPDVLRHFRDMELDKMRHSLRVTFVGEPGVDEGGLMTEMFTLFFESILQGDGGYFVSSAEEGEQEDPAAPASGAQQVRGVVLPSPNLQPEQLPDLRAFGRAMVKALYEGRRMGSKLCPSVFKFLTDTAPNMRDLQMFDPQTVRSLQWMLATIGNPNPTLTLPYPTLTLTLGVSEYGLHFESIGAPDLGPVTDQNKGEFVRLKVDRILVQNRLAQLTAIKVGFVEALKALSSEAAPFLSLLSHADWRILLCGDEAINAMKIVSCLKFSGFPKKSLVPQWLSEVLASSSEDHLRKFLVFVTGSPSLSSSARSRGEINVRCQPRSSALPLAHTCFFHLDIPDYRDKEILQAKLLYAIQNANTFEVV